MPRFITFIVFVALVASLFFYWTQETKAECLPFGNSVISRTDFDGLDDVYFGAKNIYLVVNMEQGAHHLPKILKEESVSRIAEDYLEKQMLSCIGHTNVRLIDKVDDKHLEEPNALIVYIEIKYLDAIPKSANAARGSRSEMAMIRAGYFRTAPYHRFQIFNDNVEFISLDKSDDEIEEITKPFIRRLLYPKAKSLPVK